MKETERNFIKEVFIICLLTLGAIVVRCLLFDADKIIDTDSVQYLTLAKNIMNGAGFISDGSHYPDIIRPPLYPVLVGLFHLVIKDLGLSGRLVSIVFGSLLVILVYAITKKLFGRLAAIFSSIVVILHPVFTSISLSAVTDATFAFFVNMAIFLGWLSIDKKNNKYFLLTGIIFGVSYLSRQIGILFFCGYFLFAIFWLKRDGSLVDQIVKNITVLLIGFLILFIPYMAWVKNYNGLWIEPGFKFAEVQAQWEVEVNKRLKGNNLPGNGLPDEVRKYEAIHHGLSDDGKEIMLWEKMKESRSGDSPIDLSKQKLRNISYNLYSLLNQAIPSIFPTFLFFFMVFGIIGQEWSKAILKKHLYLAFFFVVSILFVSLSHLEERYLVPSIIIAAIWAGNGANNISDFCRNSVKKTISKNYYVVVCIFLLMASLLPGIYKIHIKEKDEPVEQKRAGLWLKINKPNSVIMSRKPQISFYAEGKYVALPFASYRDIMEFARVKNAKIMVVDERYIPSARPELINLLKEIEVPKVLRLIYKDEEIHDAKILLYEIEYNQSQ